MNLGLIDAYRQSAELVVKNVKLIKWVLLKDLTLKLDYSCHKVTELIILEYNGKIYINFKPKIISSPPKTINLGDTLLYKV